MNKIVACFVLTLIFVSTADSVFAHAAVVACAPRIGANLAQPPSQIVCQFDQPLDPAKSSLKVTAPNGQQVDKNDVRLFEGDRYSIVVSLDASKMSPGIYTVQWSVTDPTDNVETSGTVQFGINTVVPPTPTVVLPGQVILTPDAPVNTVASNSSTDLISRFLIGLGVILLVVMGILYWRTRQSEGF
ncbi:MAG: copper resistance protein CopC [Chloroflexi bacterium]|nr:copper resistance protein CopC [Chloroflexota bacterium]